LIAGFADKDSTADQPPTLHAKGFRRLVSGCASR
jgi:hypothetical protein